MKLMKRAVEIICALCIVISSVYSVVILDAASPSQKELTLQDKSKWIVKTDFDTNTFSSDGDGKYLMATNKPGATDSAFSIISQKTYPLSTKFQLQCAESSGYFGEFGLTSEYSLNLDDSNSIKILKQNGSPSENVVKLFVVINSHTYCIKTTDPYFTRLRVSTIGVGKKNDSYYMTWNEFLLDGEGCSDEVKEYLKLENHFSKAYLDSNASLHFYANTSSLLYSDGFFVKSDRTIDNGIMKQWADIYPDPNDFSTVTKTSAPETEYDSDTGKYSMTFKDNNTSVTPMVPVTTFNEDLGVSDSFEINCYLNNYNDANQYWMAYSFSNDPTFSDGSEITIWNARIAGGAVHFGCGSVTYVGLNANYYNDPNDSARVFLFKTNPKDGKVNLYVWGGNILPPDSAACIGADFSNMVGKPIYMKIGSSSLLGATAKFVLTPSTGINTTSKIKETEDLSKNFPTSLQQAEEIISKYDSSPYRFAISPDASAKFLSIRNYMLSERESELKQKINSLKTKIDNLPTADEMRQEYNPAIKSTICDIYLEYLDLQDNKDRLPSTYLTKLMEDIDALSELDSEFREKKTIAEAYDNEVNAVGNPEQINVENYENKNNLISNLLKTYDEMDAFQKSLVKSDSLIQVNKLTNRISELKNAYDAVSLIKLLPNPSSVKYSDNNAITLARNSLNHVENIEEIPTDYVNKLVQCEQALDEAKVNELDWYSKNPDVTYKGNNNDSYQFADTFDKVSGVAYATTTHKFDMISNRLYWVGMACGGGQFMLLNLTADVRATNISESSKDNICFVLRPTASGLNVCFYDVKGEAEYVGVLGGFDYSGLHTFDFTKSEDNHWYICVDGKMLTSFSYDRFDSFMETYGENCHVAIGGMNGFAASNVVIKDKNVVSGEGDWMFSLPFGCSVQGSESATLSLKKGSQAVYQKKLTGLDGWKIGINFNLQDTLSDTFVGFLNDSSANGNYSCGDGNGVCIRFINHPTPTDYRTHILLLVNNQWTTLCAKEPSIIDSKDFTLSVVKDVDRHYYLKVEWESGSVVIKLDRSSEFYRNLQLDSMVESGGYFTIATNSDMKANLNMEYSEPEETEEEDNTATINFILDFENHIDGLAKNNESDYNYINKKWQSLDFFTRNNVSADLMEDDFAYNILLNVEDYKDGDLSEYYYTTETITVPKSELTSTINKYLNSGENAEYTFSYPDGTLIYTDMGKTDLSVPETGNKDVISNTLLILFASVSIAWVSGIYLLKNKKVRK